MPNRPQVNFKDRLVGDILGAYAQAFRFDRVEEAEVESDIKLDDLVEGMVDVKLSKETKSRIRAPWTKALIVKSVWQNCGIQLPHFQNQYLMEACCKDGLC